MTIYGKNLYKRGKKRPPAKILQVAGVTPRGRIDVALDEKYGKARKIRCKRCGAVVFLIKNKSHEVEPGKAGCHEMHKCKELNYGNP